MPTDSEHAPVTERYPELADIDEQDNDRKLETYRNVLESLQHELDNSRVGGWWAERKIYDRAAYRSRDST